jgi:3-oxoacyl-[acyl-carrier-protein] synthase II
VTGLAITGAGVISPAGRGVGSLARAVADDDGHVIHPAVTGLYEEELPADRAAIVADFDGRSQLGRKGTSALDRVTLLTLVAGEYLFADWTADLDDIGRDRVGVVLATTAGSLKSTCDFSAETLNQDKPYLVNPVLFPNTVMNCAASQLAIRKGLRGVNATLAVGQLGLLAALKYASGLLGRGHAAALIVGTSEEFTPHTAWIAHRASASARPAGEGAALFAVEPVDEARSAGRAVDAELLAVATCYGSYGGMGPVERSVRSVISTAGLGGSDVRLVLTGDADIEAGGQACVVRRLIGARGTRWLTLKRIFGEGGAVTTGLQAAAVVAWHRADPGRDGAVSLLTACTPDGASGAVLLRGWSRAGGGGG